MAVAINLSAGVDMIDSDCDDNEKSTKSTDFVLTQKLPEVVTVATSPNIAQATNQRTGDLSSTNAYDALATHGILKQLLKRSPSDNETLTGEDLSSNETDNSASQCVDSPPPPTRRTRKSTAANNHRIAGSGGRRNDGLAHRLETHKQIEQRRRYELSTNLNKLQSLLYPEDKKGGKLPQLCILDSAITKVKTLKQANKKLMKTLKEVSAYHKQLCKKLADLGHPVDLVPDTKTASATDTQVPEVTHNSVSSSHQSESDESVTSPDNKELKSVDTGDIPNHSGPNSSGMSPNHSCCDSFVDMDSTVQSDGKDVSESSSQHSENVSMVDPVDCDQPDKKSDSVNCDRTDSDRNTPNQPLPQPATDLIGCQQSNSDPDTSKTNQICVNHTNPSACSARQSKSKPRPKISKPSVPSHSSGCKESEPEFPSLLGRMFEDVENSLLKRAQEGPSTPGKVTITENNKSPVSLTCVPGSGLVLTKCNNCSERVAFSDKIPGLVICPACSCVIIHFSPEQLQSKKTRTETPSPAQAKLPLTTKRKKASPQVVIDLDSDSDHESNHQGATPSRVTPSDVLDILKDGVRGYVDNVDGDEVIVVLK